MGSPEVCRYENRISSKEAVCERMRAASRRPSSVRSCVKSKLAARIKTGAMPGPRATAWSNASAALLVSPLALSNSPYVHHTAGLLGSSTRRADTECKSLPEASICAKIWSYRQPPLRQSAESAARGNRSRRREKPARNSEMTGNEKRTLCLRQSRTGCDTSEPCQGECIRRYIEVEINEAVQPDCYEGPKQSNRQRPMP